MLDKIKVRLYFREEKCQNSCQRKENLDYTLEKRKDYMLEKSYITNKSEEVKRENEKWHISVGL